MSVFDFEHVGGVGSMVELTASVIQDKQLSELIKRAQNEHGVNAVLSRAEEIVADASFSQDKRASAQMLMSAVRSSRKLNHQMEAGRNPFVKDQ